MTRVSDLQKGQEMVVVDSRKLLPFSFQFFGSFAAMFAEEVDSFDTMVAEYAFLFGFIIQNGKQKFTNCSNFRNHLAAT